MRAASTADVTFTIGPELPVFAREALLVLHASIQTLIRLPHKCEKDV